MLNKRIQAINGKGKMSLADMAKHGPMPHMESEYAKAQLDKLMELTAEKARHEAMAEMMEEMDGLKEKLALSDESKENEAELFGQVKEQLEAQKAMLEAQNAELRSSMDAMKAEIKAMKDMEISKDLDHDMATGVQKGIIRELENKLSEAMGRLAQADKQIYELRESAKQIPMPLVIEKPIPSFEFKPVKDMNGNIVKVTATPIGG